MIKKVGLVVFSWAPATPAALSVVSWMYRFGLEKHYYQLSKFFSSSKNDPKDRQRSEF